MSRQKMKRREQKTVTTVDYMLPHIKLMSQYRARLKDKKFCCDINCFVATKKFMSRQNSEDVENDKLCCNKAFMSRHKTLMS